MQSTFATEIAQQNMGPATTAAATASLSGQLHGGMISLVTTADGLWRLEEKWRGLEAGAARAHNVFQSFDWVMNWVRAYVDGSGRYEPCVITGFRGDELVFVWPMMREAHGSFRVLRWLSEPLAQYGDVLLAQGEDAEVWGREALTLLTRLRHIDTIRLRHVRADATCGPFLARTFREANHIDHAPSLDLTTFAGVTAYENRYTPSQRKRRKKIRKALEAAFGPLEFTVLKPGAYREEVIARAIAEKCAWLDERGRHNWVLCQRQLANFLSAAARGQNPDFEVVVSEMTAGGKAVSWEIGLRFGGRHFAFITSHVNELTDYSPARLHMDFSQRQALADGLTAFDLMVPNDDYKQSWSSGQTETRDYHLPITKRGWVYGRLYLEGIRPLIRDAYYRLPPAALRLVKRVVK